MAALVGRAFRLAILTAVAATAACGSDGQVEAASGRTTAPSTIPAVPTTRRPPRVTIDRPASAYRSEDDSINLLQLNAIEVPGRPYEGPDSPPPEPLTSASFIFSLNGAQPPAVTADDISGVQVLVFAADSDVEQWGLGPSVEAGDLASVEHEQGATLNVDGYVVVMRRMGRATTDQQWLDALGSVRIES